MANLVNRKRVVEVGSGDSFYYEIYEDYYRKFGFIIGVKKGTGDDERTELYETGDYGSMASVRRGLLARLGLLGGVPDLAALLGVDGIDRFGVFELV